MNVIIPFGYLVEIGRLRQQLDQAHFAWWREHTARQPEFKLENIRFKHVPGWNRRVFSIQSAHDANHSSRVIWVGMGGSI